MSSSPISSHNIPQIIQLNMLSQPIISNLIFSARNLSEGKLIVLYACYMSI